MAAGRRSKGRRFLCKMCWDLGVEGLYSGAEGVGRRSESFQLRCPHQYKHPFLTRIMNGRPEVPVCFSFPICKERGGGWGVAEDNL